MNCIICGKKSEKERCFQHVLRKPLRTNGNSLSKGKGFSRKYKPLSPEIVENINKQNEFFLSIWKKRAHCSELSGEKLFSPPSSAYFHHIILKENCEEGRYDEENIIILSLDEHTNVHSNKFRYEEINKRRKILEKKYNI